MPANDDVYYILAMCLLLAYMAYYAWRNGSLMAMLTAPFTDGGTEGVIIGVTIVTCLYWFVEGWHTDFMVAAVAIAIALFLVGRKVERIHSQLH